MPPLPVPPIVLTLLAVLMLAGWACWLVWPRRSPDPPLSDEIEELSRDIHERAW